jgi:16S rRNA (cytosine967-C5)-methyltransferase
MVVGVLSKANRQVPADAALRSALKSARGISPEAAREISETVFKYYRWMGWLEPSASVASQVEHAAEIAARFARNPASFSTEELRTKAVPEWIHQELDATESWLRSLQELPQLWLRAQPGHAAALAAQLPVQSGPFDNSFRFQGSVDLFTHPLFQAGEFEIQDIASQAVGVICAPKGTEAWWDACAGEGGKTLHLSAMMGGRGTIWASDRAAWRLERLRRRTARSHCFNYRTVEWDGGAKLPTRTLFDGVLVDAPCSGVGTWGRNPHARWTTTLEDVLELAQTQQRLLAHSSAAIKPGGRLIYSVCTVTRSETTSVVEAFNREHGADFEPLPVANPFRPEAPANSQWLWWPDETGGNGMFVAAWKRKQAV